MFTNLKKSFISRVNDKYVVKYSSHLKFFVILPCDSSIIAICISEWCHFSDVHISQGSIATCLKRGGIFKHEFVANLLPSPLVKKFWKSNNRWWSYDQEFDVLFFYSRCIRNLAMKRMQILCLKYTEIRFPAGLRLDPPASLCAPPDPNHATTQEGHPACKTEWWGAGVVICLERGADLLMGSYF